MMNITKKRVMEGKLYLKMKVLESGGNGGS
jgi:hypothetical protein